MRYLRIIKNWIRNGYDGNRMKIAGWALFILGLVYGLPIVEPRILEYIPVQILEYLPESNLVLSYLCFIGTLIVWGVAGKLEKIKDSIESTKNWI